MDITKYIATAVVLTSIFGGITQKWVVTLAGGFTVALTLGVGLMLVNDKKKGK
jgi:hypothetical protein